MAIEDTDLLLINRDGASYKLATTDDLFCTLQESDVALVNRSGSSYKLTGDELAAGNFDDTDLFMISRAGVSYQVPGSEIRPLTISSVPPAKRAKWELDPITNAYYGRIFRMRIYFDELPDTTQPIEVRLTILSDTSSNPMGQRYPLTSLVDIRPSTHSSYTAIYKTYGWDRSDTPEKQTVSPKLYSSTGGLLGDPWIGFDMEVPHTIKIDGVDTRTKYSGVGGGLWTGTVGVYQNCKGSSVEFDAYRTNSDWWN